MSRQFSSFLRPRSLLREEDAFAFKVNAVLVFADAFADVRFQTRVTGHIPQVLSHATFLSGLAGRRHSRMHVRCCLFKKEKK